MQTKTLIILHLKRTMQCLDSIAEDRLERLQFTFH